MFVSQMSPTWTDYWRRFTLSNDIVRVTGCMKTTHAGVVFMHPVIRMMSLLNVIHFCRKPTQLLPLAVRVSGDVITSSIPTTPPWLLTRPEVNFTLHCSDKSNTPPEIFKHRFYELCHKSKNYYRIYNDGSKEGNRVAAAVVHRDNTISVFDYKHLQSWIICPSACDRCGPALKRKEFCNLFWFHVKSAIYPRL